MTTDPKEITLPIFSKVVAIPLPLERANDAPSYQEYLEDPDWVLNDPRN